MCISKVLYIVNKLFENVAKIMYIMFGEFMTLFISGKLTNEF